MYNLSPDSMPNTSLVFECRLTRFVTGLKFLKLSTCVLRVLFLQHYSGHKFNDLTLKEVYLLSASYLLARPASICLSTVTKLRMSNSGPSLNIFIISVLLASKKELSNKAFGLF